MAGQDLDAIIQSMTRSHKQVLREQKTVCNGEGNGCCGRESTCTLEGLAEVRLQSSPAFLAPSPPLKSEWRN